MPPRDRPVHKTNDPAVILDVELADGLLWLVLINRASHPVRDVTVDLGRSILGLGGTLDMRKLELFHRLTYLAPEKTIRVPMDVPAMFFRHNRGKLLNATVVYTDLKGNRIQSVMRHNLNVYRNFPDISLNET